MPAKISIVVPVYNTSKYLNKCVKSMVKQTYSDWELLLVDDKSTDNSCGIADRWAAADGRVKVIRHETNKGADAARQTGLAAAGGEYVMFADSDDWISREALGKLLEKIEQEQADIAFGAMVRVLGKRNLVRTKPKNTYSGLATESITQPRLFDEYFVSYFGVNLLTVSMCSKLYRVETLRKVDLRPLGFAMGEDLMFNIRLHPLLTKVCFIEDTVYYYRYGGMTTKSNPRFLENIKQQFRMKQEMIEKYDYRKAQPFIEYELLNCFYSYLNTRFLVDRLSYEQVKEIVRAEVEDPLYATCTHAIELSERNKAVADKDVELITRTAFESARASRKTYTIKRILNKFI